MARFHTASRCFCEIAWECFSHNRLTSAEDNEEALLLRYPPIGLVDQGSLRGGNNQGQPYIPGRNAEALRPKKGKYFKCRFLMAIAPSVDAFATASGDLKKRTNCQRC